MAERKKPLPRVNLLNARPPYDEADGDYTYFADAEGRPAADRHPFLPGARGFELANAWWLCEAATLAYSAPETVERTFGERTPLRQFRAFDTDGGTQCFVAWNRDFAVVTFRGTEISPQEGPGGGRDFRDIFRDIGADADIRTSVFGEGALVHRGFAEALDGVWDGGGLRDFIGGLDTAKVWVTGHSLGAALATLAAARSERLDGVYTFGSPRVGDEGFAAAFSGLMAGKGVECFRVVNHEDLVTKVPIRALPPGTVFKHVGSLKRIERDGSIHDGEPPPRGLKEALRDLLPFGADGKLDPRFFNFIPNAVDDHVPTLYATHIWNEMVGG